MELKQDTTFLITEIDQLGNQLYELTDDEIKDEIKIVEGEKIQEI